jgi:thiamine-monophosphate kinase
MSDVGSIGERELVRRIRRALGAGASDSAVLVGPGDDAAVLAGDSRRAVWTVDRQREGVHFETRWLDPAGIGHRAVLVAASDVAAMGGAPRWILCSLELPGGLGCAAAEALVAGVRDGAAAAGAVVIGGDVGTGVDTLGLTISVGGQILEDSRPLLRSGCRPGHELWIVGDIGFAGLGRHLLERDHSRGGAATDRCRRAYRRPRVPFGFARWAAGSDAVQAMMDVSDGVAIDVHRLCEESAVGVRLDPAGLVEPELAEAAAEFGIDALDACLGGGDDYALLCAVEPGHGEALRTAADGLPCRCAGTFTAPEDGLEVGDRGALEAAGWDPFAGAS